ncbi:TPR end-of-group domain-containing protein [Culturomica massiliensis]|uniref:TPR end-of-group domain-containing protein n=1 Tax=Culturomica massiliensis TaxID=1841857 RepID=UPI002665119A|nr:transglutaminase domain-containing protein [Culturomica massiliensis]
MKKRFFFLCCFGLCFLLGGFMVCQWQSGMAQTQQDRLQTALKQVRGVFDDVVRVMGLSDYPKAVELSYQLLGQIEDEPDFKPYIKKQLKSRVYYNLACAYALAGERKKAAEVLGESLENGFDDYEHIMTDTDLNPIREEAEFKKLLQGLRQSRDYVTMLQKAFYTGVSFSDTLRFTYQPEDDPELAEIRKYFNLDSIAGEGDEISRIKNLLAWVHNAVRHDGNSYSPEQRNAIDLIRICRTENRGINCRMMAIILNECYLAMGFPSRFVTCLPKSETDTDCHVITIVYSRMLHKWIWMDPTFNAYVSDEDGMLLGIAEVRERLVMGKPLVLNEDANWNNRTRQTKESYLDRYMAKNLYWFECTKDSRRDVESVDGRPSEYVSLLPKDFRHKYASGYMTSNPDYFWQTPE